MFCIELYCTVIATSLQGWETYLDDPPLYQVNLDSSLMVLRDFQMDRVDAYFKAQVDLWNGGMILTADKTVP